MRRSDDDYRGRHCRAAAEESAMCRDISAIKKGSACLVDCRGPDRSAMRETSGRSVPPIPNSRRDASPYYAFAVYSSDWRARDLHARGLAYRFQWSSLPFILAGGKKPLGRTQVQPFGSAGSPCLGRQRRVYRAEMGEEKSAHSICPNPGRTNANRRGIQAQALR